jgi:protein tyrosine phosphatase (PTP) superfamily phosphohydrolase (DUF442 family)
VTPSFVHRLLALAKSVALCLVGLFVCLAAAYAFVHGAGNFHEVERGVLYRSSWLGEPGLAKAIDRHGVRSVLNLCGEHPGDAWYDGEMKVARAQGLVFRSLSFSAKNEPSATQVAELVEFLRTAPKPLLIHCRAGSDRTGLACALFVALRGGSLRDAQEQLSVYYGHFPFSAARRSRWTTPSTVSIPASPRLWW